MLTTITLCAIFHNPYGGKIWHNNKLVLNSIELMLRSSHHSAQSHGTVLKEKCFYQKLSNFDLMCEIFFTVPSMNFLQVYDDLLLTFKLITPSIDILSDNSFSVFKWSSKIFSSKPFESLPIPCCDLPVNTTFNYVH